MKHYSKKYKQELELLEENKIKDFYIYKISDNWYYFKTRDVFIPAPDIKNYIKYIKTVQKDIIEKHKLKKEFKRRLD